MFRLFRPLLALFLWSLALPAMAQRVITVNTGVHTDIPTIVEGIVNLLLLWSSFVATALFLLGALFMVGSGGNEQFSSAGKKIMKAAMIGFAIVLASWLIISTAVFFIAG
jgi:hypothetical protein